MTALNVTVFDSVLGLDDYVEKLKDTAVAYGWTLHDFQQNVQWQTGGFVAGSESFLQISTTGFGGQSIFVRIKTEIDSFDVLSDNLRVGMHKTNTFSTATSTHPVFQSNWNTNTNNGTSYSPTSIPMLWIFGNDKVIFTVAQHTATQVVFQYFGALEQFDPAFSDGDFTCVTGFGVTKWYSGQQRMPFDGFIDTYYNGGLVSSFTNFGVLRSYTATGDTISNADFGHSADEIIQPNNVSEKRMLDKQIVYVKDTDGQYFPHARNWIRRCYAADLAIGQRIKFGTKEYLVFPNADNNFSEIGVAVRVA